jgi:diadenosine tetraphosphate (Ap4A) HIT family hydrolase
MTTGCVYCEGEGGRRLWHDGRCRVVLTDEPFAGFCRVIWNAHVCEMTDLGAPDRAHLMHVVCAVESALRARLLPAKMNLASLGNVVPHLHWHVIPRYADDSHFPQPVWGPRQRPGLQRAMPDDLSSVLARDLAGMLGAGSPAAAAGP